MAERKRNLRREYDTYQGTPLQKKRRAERNAARRKLMKEGRVHKGDGLEVDHKSRNIRGHLSNDSSNLQVLKARVNRAKNSRPY